MNTQQLLSFVQVAENLSFRKAAQRLYLSVPTISRNIQALEAELGVSLLIRDKHSVRLTAAGTGFYDDAVAILEAQDLARSHAVSAQRQTFLRIGCTSRAELSWMAPSLQKLRRKRPDVIPLLRTEDYAQAIPQLFSRNIDLLLGSDNMARENKHCCFTPFGQQNSYAIAAADDKLAGRETLSFADLQERVMLVLPERMIPFYSRNVIKDFVTLHSRHVRDIECSDEYACLALARAGYGICVLPEYRIPACLDGCVKIPVVENEPYVYGALTADEVPSEAAGLLLELLARQYKNQ